MDKPENDIIVIFAHKEITRLYRIFLELLEDIKKNNDIMLKKVAGHTSPELAESINYFTPEFHEQVRKRVLDNGNDCNRQILSFLDFFDFQINAEKVTQAASQKRVVKKFVTMSPVDYNKEA